MATEEADLATAALASVVTELTYRQCLDLLGQGVVGRVVVIANGRPEVFPVNYRLDGDGILFRTAAGTKLDGIDGPVAFEVDELDASTRSGWSVVVHGHAHLYTRFDSPEPHPASEPWDSSPKPHLVRLTPNEMTGRRIGAIPPPPA